MKMNIFFKRAFSGIISTAFLLSAIPNIPVNATTGTTVYTYDGYEVSYSVSNEWSGGQNVSVTVTNTGDESILNWALKYDAEGSIENLYNAVIFDSLDTQYVIKNNNWNFEIAPNQSVSFGYDLYDDSFAIPTNFEICSERTVIGNGYEVEVNYTDTWDTGVRGEITINNTSDEPLEAWTLSFDTNFIIDNVWDGRLISSNNNSYVIGSESWSNPIAAGASKTIGFVGTKAVDEDPCIENYTISSVVINAYLENTTTPDNPCADKLDTIFAFGSYDAEESSIILDWYYNDETGNFKIYEISNGKMLIDEVTDDTTYYYEIDEEIEEYYFIIEKEKADKNVVSNVIFMKKSSNGTYDLTLQFDDSIINNINENSLRDIQALNEHEEYPLEVQFNDNETQITSISGKYSKVVIDSPEDAIYSIYNIKTLLGINEPKAELQLTNMNYSNSGVTYSFVQLYNGVKVYGSDITVSVDNYGNAISLSSTITESDVISSFIGNIPELDSDDIDIFFQEEFPNLEILQSELLVYVDDEKTRIELAYLVYAIENDEFKIKIININTGNVIEEYSTYNNEMITGTGFDEGGAYVNFPVNKEIVDYYGKQSDSGELTFYPHHIRYTLEDTSRKIYMYDNSNGDNKFINIENMKSISNPIEWTDGAAISAYRNIITAYDWWKLKFGYKGLNGKGGKVNSYVHDSQLRNNAEYYWTIVSEEIRFGDHDFGKPSMVSDLSTIGHEYAHSMVRHKTNNFFAMKKEKAGTINEAYADIFGSFVNNNTWMTDPRDIANPAPKNPSYVGDSYFSADYSDEHTNSTIISHAAYLMQYNYGISFDKLHTLWYDSLAEGYSTSSDFYTVRTNVIKSARKNKFSYQEISSIKNAFDDVGVTEDTGSVKISVLNGNSGVNSIKVSLINYGKTEESYTEADGDVTFSNVEIGTNTIKIDIPGHESIFTQILVRKGKLSEKSINLINSMNLEDTDYTIYDHFNYPEPYSNIKEHHVLFVDNSIKMIGYSSDPLKDFILVNNTNSTSSSYNQLQISFNIRRDSADWHTMEGGGVLFNTSVTSDNLLTGYCALITQEGLKLYYINEVNINLFRNGNMGNISNVGELLETYDIGNVLDNHEISLKISGRVVTLWDGDSLIIDNYVLPYNTQSYDFGLITSHISHACHQISYFTFSDIEMNIITES